MGKKITIEEILEKVKIEIDGDNGVDENWWGVAVMLPAELVNQLNKIYTSTGAKLRTGKQNSWYDSTLSNWDTDSYKCVFTGGGQSEDSDRWKDGIGWQYSRNTLSEECLWNDGDIFYADNTDFELVNFFRTLIKAIKSAAEEHYCSADKKYQPEFDCDREDDNEGYYVGISEKGRDSK